MSFELKGATPEQQRANAWRVIDNTRLCSITGNLGDTRDHDHATRINDHACARVSPEAKAAAGVGEGLIRLAVGLETVADLKAGLAARAGGVKSAYGVWGGAPAAAAGRAGLGAGLGHVVGGFDRRRGDAHCGGPDRCHRRHGSAADGDGSSHDAASCEHGGCRDGAKRRDSEAGSRVARCRDRRKQENKNGMQGCPAGT
ncbi:PLP-dependent transferase [Cupriavidus basilensis]